MQESLDYAGERVKIVAHWRVLIASAIDTLHGIAGTTEDEFLQVGAELQEFYQRSRDISGMADRLLEVVSGECVQALTGRLQQILDDMEAYLATARSQSGSRCSTLSNLSDLLAELDEPLESFQKMNKALRMLSISTKIESARLSESGSGFTHLALDVERLSYQVSEKSSAIIEQRQLLAAMIAVNLDKVHNGEATMGHGVNSALNSTVAGLGELLSVNERCTEFAATVSAISEKVTTNIGTVVSSMQFHDITRQQVEHIFEALERLSAKLAGYGEGAVEQGLRRALVVEVGDVCELQEAQLLFAASELFTAVRDIVDNLREVASEQARMARETLKVAAGSDSTGTSFVDAIKEGMTAVTGVLCTCAQADRGMHDTMGKVAQAIDEIAGFVYDIDYIGSEIDLIAVNAQIKAAHTGPEGAALGVLAQAIKRLADESASHTGSVASILQGMTCATAETASIEDDGADTAQRVELLQDELGEILRALANVNSRLNAVLFGLSAQVVSLNEDVTRATAAIDVHERVKVASDGVLGDLDRIVAQSREVEPASTEFKRNLLHMEERYTMDSERHVHEVIARKRGVPLVITAENAVNSDSTAMGEFGDNVDLF